MDEMLQPVVQEHSPFDETVKTNMPVTWVKPELVCEIKFSEVTNDGKLRHPIFLHLREDKSSKEVTMANTKTITKKEAEKEEADDKNEKSKIYTFGKIKVTKS